MHAKIGRKVACALVPPVQYTNRSAARVYVVLFTNAARSQFGKHSSISLRLFPTFDWFPMRFLSSAFFELWQKYTVYYTSRLWQCGCRKTDGLSGRLLKKLPRRRRRRRLRRNDLSRITFSRSVYSPFSCDHATFWTPCCASRRADIEAFRSLPRALKTLIIICAFS